MGSNLPALPPKDSTDWYAWVRSLHAALSTATQDGDLGRPGTATGDALRAAFVPQATVALRRFYAAIGNRQAAGAQVWCIGDSITEGQGATSVDLGWVNLLRDQLRAQFSVSWAKGGVGFLPPFLNTTGVSEPGVTRSGGNPGNYFGPGCKVLEMDGTATVTYSVFGTSCDVLYAKGSGILGVSVDGGAVTQIDATAGPAQDGQVRRFTFATRDSHTVTISAVSGACYHTGLFVYDQDENAGIHMWNGGRSGYSSNDWLTNLTAARITEVAQLLQPALVVYSLGANDFLHSEGSAALAANTATILDAVRAGCTKPPTILIHVMYATTFTGGTAPEPWDNFAQVLRNYAAAHSDCAVLDETLRMPAVAGDTLGLYADAYHPGVSGHQMIADAAAGFLRAR